MCQDITDDRRTCNPHPHLHLIPPSNVQSIFSAIDERTHRVQQDLIRYALDGRAVKVFEPVILTQVDIYLKHLFECSQGPEPRVINMTDRFNYLTLDVVCLLVFGRSLDTQTAPEFRFVKDEILAENYFRNLKLQFPILTQLGIARLWRFVRDVRGRQNYRKLEEKLVNSYAIQYEPKNTDLYSTIARSMNTKRVQNHTQIRTSWAQVFPFLSMGMWSR